MSLFCDNWHWGGLGAHGGDARGVRYGRGLGARRGRSLGFAGRAAVWRGRAVTWRTDSAGGLGCGEGCLGWWRRKGAVTPGGEEGVEAGNELAELDPDQESGRKLGDAAPVEVQQQQDSTHRPRTGDCKRGQQLGEWRGFRMHLWYII